MSEAATIIDGRLWRDKILEELKETVKQGSLEPKLAIIQVGDDPASLRYIRQKITSVEKIGASASLYHLSERTTFPELKKLIAKLNRDQSVHGIIVQIPLPGLLKDYEEETTKMILESKDIDGFREDSPFPAATPAAILEILKREKVSLKDKTVVLVGKGKLVGGPLGKILDQKKDLGKLIQVDKDSPQPLAFYTKQADVLISATGQAKLITGKMLKDAVVVIDVGISVDPETGKVSGDVDFDSAREVASKITPVPGGVGPMTVAMLLKNLVTAANLDKDKI